MNERCDIAIVGGGFVGSALAAALRELPLSVVLIEARAAGAGAKTDTGGAGTPGGGDARGIVVSCGSACFLRRLGPWEEIAGGGAASPIREVHVSRRGRFGVLRLRASECGVEALGYVVAASALGRGLGAAAGCPRIDAVVEGVEQRGGDALVTARRPDGAAIAIAARLVVGADGADSVVRRAAGLALREHRGGHVALAGRLTPTRPHDGRAFERFTERGPLAVLPFGEDRCAFVWAMPAAVEERIGAADGAAGERHADLVARAFGRRLGELREVAVHARHPLRICHAPRVAAERTVLIGNAANTLHPVGAQGFNLGLRDVRALAAALAEAAAAGADPASEAARYHAARRADHRMARALTGGLLGVYASNAPPLPTLGAAGLFALDRLGPVKRRLVSMTAGTGREREQRGRRRGWPWPSENAGRRG